MPNVQPASAVYRALDASRNEIRLLMVQPRQDGLPTAPVRCSLRYTFLSEDDRLEYEAVSYCWGDSDTEASIWLDEIELSVPESAAEVLKHFQPTERPRLLWIDAVCINLKDPEERSSQVAMMASIYGQCVQTIAYLRGPTQHDHAAALQLEEILAKVRALGGTEGLRANEADPYQAHDESIAQAYSHLVAVLACRWFSRLWTVQEAYLPPVCLAYFGTQSHVLQDLFLAVRWFYLHIDMDETGLRPCRTFALLYDQVRGQRQGSALAFIFMTSRFDVRDPKDRIYATLGIIRPALATMHLRQDDLAKRLRPDYTKSIAQVWLNAMSIYMDASRSAWWLLFVRHDTQESVSSTELASWVPRFDQVPEPVYAQATGIGYRPTAGMSDLGDLDRPHPYRSGVLVLHGLEIDSVVEVVPLGMLHVPNEDRLVATFHAWHRIKDALSRRSVPSSDLKIATTLLNQTFDARNLASEDELSRRTDSFVRYVTNGGLTISDMQADFQNLDEDQKTGVHFGLLISQSCRFSSFYITASGRIGTANIAASEGDTIHIMPAVHRPLILRPCEPHHRFVSWCYLHGVMNGEAVPQPWGGKESLTRYEIV